MHGPRRAASVAVGITRMVRSRSKVKVTREHFFGTGRAGDTMKHAHATLPPTAELQVPGRAAACPADVCWIGDMLLPQHLMRD